MILNNFIFTNWIPSMSMFHLIEETLKFNFDILQIIFLK